MIHTIIGTVVSSRKQQISISMGPISVECAVPDESTFPVGAQKTIFTHFHWNQEQGPSLYGFATEEDRAVFTLVIGCSGVGPRLGLAVIADLGTTEFIEAVQTSNEKMLSQVSGIGVKKAEQMIVQLKHKVQQMIDSGMAVANSGPTHFNTVSEALKALNYSRPEIAKALEFVRSNQRDSQQTFDQLMRQALSYLSKQS